MHGLSTCSRAGRPASETSTACSSSRPTPRVSRCRPGSLRLSLPSTSRTRPPPTAPLPATRSKPWPPNSDPATSSSRSAPATSTSSGRCFCNACNRQVCDNDPSQRLRRISHARDAHLPVQPRYRHMRLLLANARLPVYKKRKRVTDGALLSALESVATLKREEPLSRHTTIGIGGIPDAYVAVSDAAQLSSVLSLCAQADAPVFILGSGSNI